MEFQDKLRKAKNSKVDQPIFYFQTIGMKTFIFKKHFYSFYSLLFSSALFFSVQALAYDDEKIPVNSDNTSDSLYPNQPSLNEFDSRLNKLNLQNLEMNGAEVFRRTELILNYFGVPSQSDPRDYLQDLQNQQSLQRIQQILPFLDPLKIFSNLSIMDNSEIQVFQDFGSKNILDFQLQLTRSNQPTNSMNSLKYLSRTLNSDFALELPLQGLKIAIDPGHMGGTYWDKKTGKYVSDSKGRIVSEGVIAVQTALLLKKELLKLGAQVLVTHETLSPVSNEDINSFDLRPYALQELADNIHADWFLKLIQSAKSDKELIQSFVNSPERKKLFSESNRDYYFIRRSDLWARADMINNFNADLVIIIHFDTADTDSGGGLNPKAPNATKAYVVGGYQQNELGSRQARKFFARHLMDQTSWQQSVQLSQSILAKFTSNLGLKLATSGGESAYKVVPGVFSRNLVIPRMLKAKAITYLECLFYNNPLEFEKIHDAKYPLDIGGKNIPYSERILHVSNAIRDGVVDFLKK